MACATGEHFSARLRSDLRARRRGLEAGVHPGWMARGSKATHTWACWSHGVPQALVQLRVGRPGGEQMRIIGMLGGMSWESTAEYYRLTNELVRDRLGGVHSARILLDSMDFADMEQLQSAGRWQEAGELLAAKASALESAGAQMLVLCTNTMHVVVDAIEQAVTIPVLHILDATSARVRQEGLSRVGVLGTAFTMEQDFYRDRLAAGGIQAIVPEPQDRATVHRIIYEELVRGVVTEASRARYRAIIGRLVAGGAEGIVLGCTEIELLVSAEDSSVPVFPTTRLHVEAAVEMALT
ncbi:aspartate/glutamate racemase family protein [Kocuria sp. U4B]